MVFVSVCSRRSRNQDIDTGLARRVARHRVARRLVGLFPDEGVTRVATNGIPQNPAEAA